MDATARDRNVDVAEVRPPFPLGSPRSRRTATPPPGDGPKVRPGECGTSVPRVGGRLLRLEIGRRSNVSAPVTDARL